MSPLNWVLLICLSLIWGGGFVLNEVALGGFPPATLVWLRFLMASMILVPLVLAFGHRLPFGTAIWRDFAVMATVNNVVPFTLIAKGQTLIDASLTSVLNATSPLFAIIVAALVSGGRGPPLRSWIGVALGIAGVAILVGPSAAAGFTPDVGGMLCILAASFSYGIAANWGRRFAGTPPIVSAACQLIAATVLLAPFVALVDQPWTRSEPSATSIAALVVLAMTSTAIAYVIFYRIMAGPGGANVMIVTLMIPASTLVLGHIFLGEVLEARQFAGAAVIGLALLLIDGRLIERLFARGR